MNNIFPASIVDWLNTYDLPEVDYIAHKPSSTSASEDQRVLLTQLFGPGEVDIRLKHEPTLPDELFTPARLIPLPPRQGTSDAYALSSATNHRLGKDLCRRPQGGEQGLHDIIKQLLIATVNLIKLASHDVRMQFRAWLSRSTGPIQPDHSLQDNTREERTQERVTQSASKFPMILDLTGTNPNNQTIFYADLEDKTIISTGRQGLEWFVAAVEAGYVSITSQGGDPPYLYVKTEGWTLATKHYKKADVRRTIHAFEQVRLPFNRPLFAQSTDRRADRFVVPLSAYHPVGWYELSGRRIDELGPMGPTRAAAAKPG